MITGENAMAESEFPADHAWDIISEALAAKRVDKSL